MNAATRPGAANYFVGRRLATPPDEWRMRIIAFARNWERGGAGDEFHFADESATPGSVNAVAEVGFHANKLSLPSVAISGKLKASADAAQGAGMRGEAWADDGRPRAFQPCERGVRVVNAANDVAEEVACAVHEGRSVARCCDGANQAEWISLRKKCGS